MIYLYYKIEIYMFLIVNYNINYNINYKKINYICYLATNNKIIKTDYSENVLEIDLSDRKIKEIIEIKGMKQLQILNLSYNQITEITGLNELKQLQILYLYNNQ